MKAPPANREKKCLVVQGKLEFEK